MRLWRAVTCWLIGAAASLPGAETRIETLDLGRVMQADWSVPHAGEAAGGALLRVGVQTYAAGFGTVGASRLELDLGGRAERLRARTGVDVAGDLPTGAQFLVVGDGRVLYRGPWQQRGGPAVPVDVDLHGVQRLALVVDVRGQPSTRADWLEPVVTHEGAPPVAVEFAPGPGEVLAPPSPVAPRLTGPAVVGARPGHPFLFRVGAVGAPPLRLAVDSLPPGLAWDEVHHVIHGTAPAAPGEWRIRLRAENAQGRAERTLTLVTGETLALTPPMGWNSWYGMSGRVSDTWVREAAEALLRTGLADHGWTQVNLDDFWMTRPVPGDPLFARLAERERAGRPAAYFKAVLDDPELRGPARDARGRIRPNARFPDMAALTAWLHERGLKAGLYSSPGVLTCGGCTGSYGHEDDDAAQFAAWGFDFLKYDWCSYYLETERLELDDWRRPYARMGAALRAQPRDLVFSLCEYGCASVWTWGADAGGQMWRVGADLVDTWGSISAAGFYREECDRDAGPGRWNDRDMLMLGRIGWNRQLRPVRLTCDEQRTHFALWCLRASPLLLAGDPGSLDANALALLTNDDAIAVSQDPLGRPARRVVLAGALEAWVRPLADGAVAVGLFNRDEEPAEAHVNWAQLALPGAWRVHDVWRGRELGAAAQWAGVVPRHGVEFFRLEPIAP